jgi:hypothetical protein
VRTVLSADERTEPLGSGASQWTVGTRGGPRGIDRDDGASRRGIQDRVRVQSTYGSGVLSA